MRRRSVFIRRIWVKDGISHCRLFILIYKKEFNNYMKENEDNLSEMAEDIFDASYEA